jgi:hypothetical protein
MTNVTKVMTATAVVAAAAAVLFATAPASAQDWKAAVAAGQIGEQSDGYLAVVGGNAGLASTVAAINIQRKKAYTDRATAEGATVEAMGIAGGCNQIKRLSPGAKYRLAGGGWQTVGQGPLQLDPRCP